MVNIIREGWCRAWKELCVLLSCNVILLGAVGTLKIPSWGVSETGVVLCCLLRSVRRAGLEGFFALVFFIILFFSVLN